MTDSYEKHTPKFLDTLNLDGRITFLNESRVYILLHSYLNVLNKEICPTMMIFVHSEKSPTMISESKL